MQCRRTNLKTGVLRKQSTSNFPKNKQFFPPDTKNQLTSRQFTFNSRTCAYQGVHNVCFLVNLTYLVFLKQRKLLPMNSDVH